MLAGTQKCSGNDDSLARRYLLLVGLGGNGLEIFGFEDLAAVDAFHVVDAIAAGEDNGFLMLAGGLHSQHLEIRIL
jgi:hypothetical protein